MKWIAELRNAGVSVFDIGIAADLFQLSAEHGGALPWFTGGPKEFTKQLTLILHGTAPAAAVGAAVARLISRGVLRKTLTGQWRFEPMEKIVAQRDEMRRRGTAGGNPALQMSLPGVDLQIQAQNDGKRGVEVNQQVNQPLISSRDYILSLWNRVIEGTSIPSLHSISDLRWVKVSRRLQERPDFAEVIEREIPQLDGWALGKTERKWVITFDWIIKSETNFLKLAEGHFRKKSGGTYDEAKF